MIVYLERGVAYYLAFAALLAGLVIGYFVGAVT